MTADRAASEAVSEAATPLRLLIDTEALAANWRWLARKAGQAECGAAVKANAYGLGASVVVRRLIREGCRDFFVSSWLEAAALGPLPNEVRVSVLHGVQASDMKLAMQVNARPVLCSPDQVARWRGVDRVCDVMVDTGMNRLGLSPAQAAGGLLEGLRLDTLHSHLSCADEPAHPLNRQQRSLFAGLVAQVAPRRSALSNTAGLCLGADYAFDLARPGLGLYGGIPHPALRGVLSPVVHVQGRVVQIREVLAGEAVGYNATFIAATKRRIAILNLGYADGLPRAIAPVAKAQVRGLECDIIGRISMDLTAVDVTEQQTVAEGDWVTIAFDLAAAAEVCGRSQYELLVGLGPRFARVATR